MYMHVSCCVILYTYACYNVLVFQKIGFFLGVFKKCCGFLKKLGFSKNVGCPGIFREIKGNTPKCPGRQTSQVGMYDNCMGVCHEFFPEVSTHWNLRVFHHIFKAFDT